MDQNNTKIADQASSPQRHPLIALLGWLGLCFAASISGIVVSTTGWYEGLNKPSWNPPGWVFGPVWTALYVMMAVAAWRVWQRGGWKAQRLPLGLFLIQFLLNAMWSPLFFGMNRPDLAFAEILLLWCALAVTLVMFWRVRRSAGILLIPYLVWVTFAAVLNFTIWQLNPQP
jgi:tryptophan-rich sensory protein